MEFTLSLAGDTKLLKLAKIATRIDREVIPRGMNKAVIFLSSYIKKEKLSGQVLKIRSTRLIKSITGRIFKSAEGLIGKVGTNVVYARIHETGGTITPKNKKFLTIPLPDALQSKRGIPRFSARQVISSPEIYGYQTTFFNKNVLFGVKGKRTSMLIPLFVLKKSVRIPARPYMQPALKETAPRIREIFWQEFQRTINKS